MVAILLELLILLHLVDHAQMKASQVFVAYLIAIVLALPNTYGDGLTDWDMASM